MNKKVLAVVIAFAVALGSLLVTSVILNRKDYNQDLIEVHLEIISERDDFYEERRIETECGSLGELLRTVGYCIYEESTYGIFVHGFYDMQEDISNQYWWCLTVNDEPTLYGADETPLKDGATYTFTLTKGW